jgi:hypothetical protein
MTRLTGSHPTLGDRFACQLGVKTGLNRAFLTPPPTVEHGLLRWGVRGRDIRPFGLRGVVQLLWPCDELGNPLPELPPGARQHLQQYFGALRRRADYRQGPPWALFRTGPSMGKHRVLWSDLARRLEAVALLPDQAGVVPLNSCYVISTADAATAIRLAAWLNSSWCRRMARAAAEPASGGFARFNARVVAALPLPDAALVSPELLALGRRGPTGTLDQKELDACCATLLGISSEDKQLLAGLAPERAQPRC